MFFESGVLSIQFVISAVIQTDIWDSFLKILEGEKHKKDTIVAKTAAEFGENTHFSGRS